MNELKQEIKSRLLEKLDHSMEMEDGKFIMRSGSMMFCRSYWKMKL